MFPKGIYKVIYYFTPILQKKKWYQSKEHSSFPFIILFHSSSHFILLTKKFPHRVREGKTRRGPENKKGLAKALQPDRDDQCQTKAPLSATSLHKVAHGQQHWHHRKAHKKYKTSGPTSGILNQLCHLIKFPGDIFTH